MTAIGFAIVVTGFVVSYINNYRSFGRLAEASAVMVFVGGMLMLAGACIKLWEIMP